MYDRPLDTPPEHSGAGEPAEGADSNAKSLATPAGEARRPGAMRRRPVERVTVAPGGLRRRRVRDALTTEEPLEIVLATGGRWEPIAVTMRTPGADFDLVAGALYSEGVIDSGRDLTQMWYCRGEARVSASSPSGPIRQLYNRVEVKLAAWKEGTAIPGRRRYTTSSCGVCGMDSIDAVTRLSCPPVQDSVIVSADLLLSLPPRLRAAQSQFESTGGLHAAALFDSAGALVCIREDVGRHNALDKLIGAALLAGEVPLADRVLLLSGRLSFELMQKASRAGIAIVAGISAPSTLAVDLAERTGITLIGFLRERGFNVYAGAHRVVLPTVRPRGSERPGS